MVIFPLAPDQTIAQMWSSGARGGLLYSTRPTNGRAYNATVLRLSS